MKSATVCERYPLSIREDADQGYAKYLGHIGAKHAKAFDFASEGIPEGLEVVELFGGVGTFSTIIRGKLKPSDHHVYELDPALVRDLKLNGFWASCEDARYVSKHIGADVIVADFPDITIFKATNGGFWEETLDNIFGQEPLYVLYTDVALRYLHLHYERYANILDRPVEDRESYIRACAEYFYDKYRYGTIRTAYHNEASVSLMVPDMNVSGLPPEVSSWIPQDQEILRIKDGSGGLRVDH